MQILQGDFTIFLSISRNILHLPFSYFAAAPSKHLYDNQAHCSLLFEEDIIYFVPPATIHNGC